MLAVDDHKSIEYSIEIQKTRMKTLEWPVSYYDLYNGRALYFSYAILLGYLKLESNYHEHKN